MDTAGLSPTLLVPAYPWLVLALVTSGIYVSFSRSRVFDDNNLAKVIVAVVLGVFITNSITNEQLETIMKVGSWATVAFLVSLLVWRFGLQRGKTREQFKQESQRVWRQQNR